MEGYDDLGPPTHPNDLALDADMGGSRELLEDEARMGAMDVGGPAGLDEHELEAPDLNADLEDFDQVWFGFRCVRVGRFLPDRVVCFGTRYAFDCFKLIFFND